MTEAAKLSNNFALLESLITSKTRVNLLLKLFLNSGNSSLLRGLQKEFGESTNAMDNLTTHKPSALYETFLPEEAKRILDRFEFIYKTNHGSWLNMAEIELNVLMGQCFNRRIDKMATIRSETKAWEKDRNNKKAKINGQFKTDDARIKPKRLFPTISY